MPARPDLADVNDQNAYMTFLEIQLERISLTCLQQQKSNELLKEMQDKVEAHDEKLVSLTRLVKLLQSFSDGQESELDKLQNQVQKMTKHMASSKTAGGPMLASLESSSK